MDLPAGLCLSFEANPSWDDREFIDSGLGAHNARFRSDNSWTYFGIFIRDQSRAIHAGLIGHTYAGWLFIAVFEAVVPQVCATTLVMAPSIVPVGPFACGSTGAGDGCVVGDAGACCGIGWTGCDGVAGWVGCAGVCCGAGWAGCVGGGG